MVNVAYKRPASQSSTWANYSASNAVDGNRNGLVEYNSCAQTEEEMDPFWAVSLGKSVWVESVLIASRTDSDYKELSDVDIIIGMSSNHYFIMHCDVWFFYMYHTPSEGVRD